MIKDPVIVIIIPAFNELKQIRSVISELVNNNYTNIVVVDDGSSQDLISELKGFNIYYLKHLINLGQGAALQTGFDFAKTIDCDIIVTFDADGQHDSKDIAILIQPIIAGEADIVFGSRFINGTPENLSGLRRAILKCARIVNYIFSGILLTDAHNGLRAFNTKTLNLLEITENKMAHASEILFEVKKHRLRFKEAGVEVRYTPYSKQKGQSGWNSLKILFDLLLHRIFRSSTK